MISKDTDSSYGKDHGGYEYQFICSPPDRVFCVICQFPSRDPYLTVCCGHVLCKSCVIQVKKRRSRAGNGCPMCRDKKFVTFPNKQIDREVKNLDVYCTNKDKGCMWSGKLNSVCRHLSSSSDGCQFEEVECSNECGMTVQRQHLPSHLENECPRRRIDCEYCQMTYVADSSHLKQCSKLPIPCPNGCKVQGKITNIPREAMNSHIMSECPLEVVKCKYHELGCDSEFLRKDQNKHNKQNAEEHLIFMQQDLTSTKQYLASALNRISSLEICLHQAINRGVNFSPSGGMTIASANWFMKLSALAAVSSVGNQTLPVVMKVSTKLNKDKYVYTNAFYTHSDGYKMRLLVYPNGVGDCSGTHLSVYLCLMNGPHDYQLTWPLKGRFHLQLVNQISDAYHHNYMVKYDYITPGMSANRVVHNSISTGWGQINFISLQDFYKVTPTSQYVKDDYAFFRIC